MKHGKIIIIMTSLYLLKVINTLFIFVGSEKLSDFTDGTDNLTSGPCHGFIVITL